LESLTLTLSMSAQKNQILNLHAVQTSIQRSYHWIG
jgi:hypothetical protein